MRCSNSNKRSNGALVVAAVVDVVITVVGIVIQSLGFISMNLLPYGQAQGTGR